MRHAAHVAHHSRGRLRIRVPSAKGDAAALEKIRSSLAKMDGVKSVDTNDIIGTVTIQYDPNRHADFHQALEAESEHQDVVVVENPPSIEDLSDVEGMVSHEAEFLAQHSHFARTLLDVVNALDREVKRATGNNIDFKVLAPLALAVGAFLELGVEASTPVWLTLSLFSFNHLIELHTHQTPPPKPPQPPSHAS